MPVNKPLFINTDSGVKNLQPTEALFLKDVEISVNKNGNQETGTANPSGEGQNEYMLTPVNSNIVVPDYLLPEGFNKHIGSFESKQTNEVYCFTYNSEGNHCIHVINGDTGTVNKIQYPYLNFGDGQENYIADNRCILRVIRDANNNIVEKILLFTDYKGWQKYVLVVTAIATDSFNDVTYPYWVTKQPHFDRRELVEWAVRPPMFMPEFIKLPNTPTDKGTPNRVLDIGFEFCMDFNNTDGRETTVSPWSLPAIIKSTDYLSNPDLIQKKYELTLCAGSPLTEKINIYVRQTTQSADSDLQNTFGPWYLYDTIYKFNQSKNNVVIGTQYWLRTNPWAAYSYDSDLNTIKYIFDNTKAGIPVDQSKFRVENDLPQISAAVADAGDAAMLGNNRHQYDNFSAEITENIGVSVVYNQGETCTPELRTVKLYCYVGRERLNQNDDHQRMTFGIWLSQVGYHSGEDDQERFGGILFPSKRDGGANYLTDDIEFDKDESKSFLLDFADKKGFTCYAKGTQFYADCEWYSVDAQFNKTKISGLIDSENTSDRDFVKGILAGGGFFVGQFTFSGLPAGRYDFALGRHNVPSDEDWQGQSTYVMGIADSTQVSTGLHPPNVATILRFTSLTPSAIVSRSKEIEVDCTAGDVDLWGLGADTFYIFCPFGGSGRDSGSGTFDFFENPVNRWSFNEGYLIEARDSVIGMEQWQYESTYKEHYSTGLITDKNGFFFTYQWGDDIQNNRADIRFQDTANCSTIDFTVSNTNDNAAGWKPNNLAYFASYNTPPAVGVANRVLVRGTITTTDGVPLARISVTIADGGTDYTNDDGEFEIVVHNGLAEPRVSNIYINAGGNFTISMANCAPIPLFVYDETSAYYPACATTGSDRVYGLSIDLQIEVQDGQITTLKSGASYIATVVGHDLAGRQTFVNRVALPQVSSFPQRDNTYGSSFIWVLLGALRLDLNPRTADIAYLSFYISKYTNYRKYLQWVANKIEFLDQNGNPTTNIKNSDLVRINIQSLLDTNIQNNFTLLSTYQFVRNDRLRIFDDGDGNLYDTATYGDVIDVEIQGTNYNQSAINANLIVPPVNTVLNSNTTASVTPDPTTLYVKYDSRFDKLDGKTGFWIELYTPELVREKLNYGECEGTFPVINGELQEYVSGGQNNPVYQPIVGGPIRYWDTYMLRRTIIGIGKYISHPFESPNITDTWGPNGISSGRSNFENPDAKQMFYVDDVIKSDSFVLGGVRNGLGSFRGSAPDTENRKSYRRASFGGIVAMNNIGSAVFILFERNWAVTDYNMTFIRSGRDGQLVTVNLSNNLGELHQRIGEDFGCSYKDVSTVLFHGAWVGWHDSKNGAYLISDWQNTTDITEIKESGRSIGVASYYNIKSDTIERWNLGKETKDKFDVVAGYDYYRKHIYITFRPRRNNSDNALSFVNRKRDFDLLSQETLCFDMNLRRWIPTRGFTPEGYASFRGNIYAQEMLSFASGLSYYHNSSDTTTWLNFYGVPIRPVIKIVINEAADVVKVLKNLKVDCNNVKWVADIIYSEEKNSFSYIPVNYSETKEFLQYLPALRDMASYPDIDKPYQCMLMDGKSHRGCFFVIRLLPEYDAEGRYFEFNIVKSMVFSSVSNSKDVTVK